MLCGDLVDYSIIRKALGLKPNALDIILLFNVY